MIEAVLGAHARETSGSYEMHQDRIQEVQGSALLFKLRLNLEKHTHRLASELLSERSRAMEASARLNFRSYLSISHHTDHKMIKNYASNFGKMSRRGQEALCYRERPQTMTSTTFQEAKPRTGDQYLNSCMK